MSLESSFLAFCAAHTWNKGDGVLAAELGRLEDVGVGGGVAWVVGQLEVSWREVAWVWHTARSDRRVCNGGAQKGLRAGVLAGGVLAVVEDGIYRSGARGRSAQHGDM